MHLYLSTDSPWKATYSNTEGQIIYKAESPRLPIGIGALPITIERAVPSNVAKSETKDTTDDAAALPGPFDFLAEVDFPANPFTESHIRHQQSYILLVHFSALFSFLRVLEKSKAEK